MHELTHAKGIFISPVGSEQNLLGEEHNSRKKFILIHDIFMGYANKCP